MGCAEEALKCATVQNDNPRIHSHGWITSYFKVVAQASEFSDHSFQRVLLSTFGLQPRASLVVTHTLIQNLPNQPTKTMRMACLKPRRGSNGGQVEKTPQEAVTLRRSVAGRDSRAFLFFEADPNPRGEVLLGSECGRRGANFGDDLAR